MKEGNDFVNLNLIHVEDEGSYKQSNCSKLGSLAEIRNRSDVFTSLERRIKSLIFDAPLIRIET